MALFQSDCYECIAIDGKGIGAVARRDIKRGELILQERPMLTVENYAETMKEAQSTNFKTAKVVDEPFSTLSDDDQQLVLDLCDECRQSGAEKTVPGIFSTNSISPGGDSADAILCVRLARLNHSCQPNVEHIFVDPVARVIACRDIQQGQELCTNYGEWKEPAEERILRLKQRYCFTCICAACTQPPSELQQSDARRRRYAKLDEQIPTLGGEPARALEMAKEAMRLLKDEGLDSPMLVARCAYYAFQMSMCLDDTAEAEKWIKLAYDEKVLTDGKDSDGARHFLRYLEDTENFWRDIEGGS